MSPQEMLVTKTNQQVEKIVGWCGFWASLKEALSLGAERSGGDGGATILYQDQSAIRLPTTHNPKFPFSKYQLRIVC